MHNHFIHPLHTRQGSFQWSQNGLHVGCERFVRPRYRLLRHFDAHTQSTTVSLRQTHNRQTPLKFMWCERHLARTRSRRVTVHCLPSRSITSAAGCVDAADVLDSVAGIVFTAPKLPCSTRRTTSVVSAKPLGASCSAWWRLPSAASWLWLCFHSPG